MESELSVLEPKIDGRKGNGCKPGENRGGGNRKPVELLKKEIKEKIYDITRAEFWAELSEKYAVPALIDVIKNGGNSERVKVAQEMLNRSLGKPRESMDVTSKGEKIEGINYVVPKEDATDA